MQIYGREVDFKISRLKDAGNMEMALNNMARTEVAIKKKGPGLLSETIKAGIKMFSDFFKDATGVDVLEGCEDLDEAKNAYLDFLGEVKKQKELVGVSLTDIK